MTQAHARRIRLRLIMRASTGAGHAECTGKAGAAVRARSARLPGSYIHRNEIGAAFRPGIRRVMIGASIGSELMRKFSLLCLAAGLMSSAAVLVPTYAANNADDERF